MNNKLNNPAPSEPSQEEPWEQRVAKLKLDYAERYQLPPRLFRDIWIVNYDGEPYISCEKNPPSGFVKAFQYRGVGWSTPPEIWEWLREKPAIKRSPNEILMELLAWEEVDPSAADEPPGLANARNIANHWCQKALEACEKVENLIGAEAANAFHEAALVIYHASKRKLILDLYRKPGLVADLARALAFRGKDLDPLSRALMKARLELITENGCEPANRQVAERTGGEWADIERCWEFDDIDGTPSLTDEQLSDRLRTIRARDP